MHPVSRKNNSLAESREMLNDNTIFDAIEDNCGVDIKVAQIYEEDGANG